VELEAQRLERGEAAAPADAHPSDPMPADPQHQIDQLRAQVARVARRLEERP
jgi:hypothetical protein